MVWKADSTLEASNAEVSMKDKPLSTVTLALEQRANHGEETDAPEKVFASSVGTALKCFKSLLFPTSMMTMLESA